MLKPETEFLSDILNLTQDDIYIDDSGSGMEHNNIGAGFNRTSYYNYTGVISETFTDKNWNYSNE